MDHKIRRITGTTIILFIVISCLVITVQSHESTGDQSNKTASLDEIAKDVYSLVTASSIKSWNTLKSLVNSIIHKQLFPPDLEGGGEDIKDAAGKSMETSKVVVEEAAKSAGNKVGEAIHNTAEKAKDEGAKTEL